MRTTEGITDYRLPNGLQILLAPDASKPTTTVNVTYHVRFINGESKTWAHLIKERRITA